MVTELDPELSVSGVRIHFSDPDLNFWGKTRSGFSMYGTQPDPNPDSESIIWRLTGSELDPNS